MRSIPRAAEPLMQALAGAFTRPTFRRFTLLLFAALLTTGRRTVTNLLRTVQTLAPGHPSGYQWVFSRRRWFPCRLARGLARFTLRHFVPDGPVLICGDDTVDEHRGKKVYGKACHRDAVRSTHSFTAYRWGHKWVVLAILEKFPFARRRWALPVLVALYYSKDWNQKHRRRHKTPSELMQQLLAVLIHWFPERKFIFAGDGGYGTHPLARFAHRHRAHLTLVSRFYPQANLYAPPPAVKGQRTGRPRKRGRKRAALENVVQRSPCRRLTVAWYGGGRTGGSGLARAGLHAPLRGNAAHNRRSPLRPRDPVPRSPLNLQPSQAVRPVLHRKYDPCGQHASGTSHSTAKCSAEWGFSPRLDGAFSTGICLYSWPPCLAERPDPAGRRHTSSRASF